MTALVLTMIRHRMGGALTGAALSLFAIAAAAAAPTFVRAAEQSVVGSVLEQAESRQLVVSVDEIRAGTRQFDRSNQAADTDWAPRRLPGFVSVLAVETDVSVPAEQPRLTSENAVASGDAAGGDAAGITAGSAAGNAGGGRPPVAGGRSHPRMVYRSGLCEHLQMVAGVCSTNFGEVLLGTETAKSLGLRPGDPMVVRTAQYQPNAGWYDGPIPLTFTVTGIYQLVEAKDPYWGRREYVAPFDLGRGSSDVLFVGMSTLAGSKPEQMRRSVDATLITKAVTPANRGQIVAEVTRIQKDSDRRQVSTELPELFQRMDREIDWVDTLVPLVAMPLVALCWYVMFIAVAYGIAARRHELALVALRGVRGPRRWWLTVAESVLPVLLAAGPGYLLGIGCVRLLAPTLLPRSVPVPMTGSALVWSSIALVGAVVAGLLAARGQLRVPVVELLHGAAVRSRRRWAWAAEILVVVLAVLAAVQLRYSGGELTGTGQLVPALLVLAVGLLAGRLLRPVARRIGNRAGRRGRTGALLAARHLARPGGTGQLIPLIAVAVALMGFCGIGAAVAERARSTNAEVALGAQRVLQVREVSVAKLLAVTRAVDPQGRYAMAVVPYTAQLAGANSPGANSLGTEMDGATSSPGVLALDSTRLASVANWPTKAGRSAAATAGTLRPSAPTQPMVRGVELLFDLSVEVRNEYFTDSENQDRDVDTGQIARSASLSVSLVAADGSVTQVGIQGLAEGRQTYPVPISCGDGCRVGQVVLVKPNVVDSVVVTVHGVRQRDATGAEQPAPAFGSEQTWTQHGGGDIRSFRSGRRGVVARGPLTDSLLRAVDGTCVVQPVATPKALPVIIGVDQTTGSAGEEVGQQLPGVDGVMMPVATAGSLSLVPRSGRTGYLVDLEYLAYTASPQVLVPAEIWLSAQAPATIVERLTGAGLVVLSQRQLDSVHRAFSEQGPAVANRFDLVASGFAVLLAVGAMLMVAAVDRRDISRYLRALRIQGVPGRTVVGVATRLYLGVAAAGLLAGLFGAALAWSVVGAQIPVFSTASAALVPPPRWPSPMSLVPEAGGLLAALGLAVAVAAIGLTRAASGAATGGAATGGAATGGAATGGAATGGEMRESIGRVQ